MAKKTKSNPRGAGRKPLGKVRLVLKVEPETALKIRRLASGLITLKGEYGQDVATVKKRKQTLGEVVDTMARGGLTT